ncbi:MAG TPA: hypothetical protein VFE53_07170 [Mucilaginibacter sp.]|jgi:hypothetical protein|nr:hypothetical protein [Mucilaginibacter sp.]
MDTEQLIQFLELLRTDVINSLQAAGSDASGQTAKSLTIVRDAGSLQLQMPGYMQLLETGRPPTSANPVAATPPMIQRIKQWCQAKGIPDKAAWAIKKSIDKKGYKGKPGILSQPLGDDNINQRLSPLLEKIADEIGELLINLTE